VSPTSPLRITVVAALLLLATTTLGASTRASARDVPSCRLSSLIVTQTTSAGLGHAWVVVRLSNVGDIRCALRGFPAVRVLLGSSAFGDQDGPAKESRPGAFVVATKSRLIYGGGVPPKGKLPVVRLAHGGVASFVFGWSPEGGRRRCPWFRSITLGVAGGWTLLGERPSKVCTPVWVTPLVSGSRGEES
jgi:hypothetical protein